MLIENYSFPIINNSTQERKLLIKFYLENPPENNQYSIYNDRIYENFQRKLSLWLYVAILDGFGLGKIEIKRTKKSLLRLSILEHIKIKEENNLVYFGIDLTNSSIALLDNLFAVIDNVYYHPKAYLFRDGYFEKNPFLVNIKLSKIIIEDFWEEQDA